MDTFNEDDYELEPVTDDMLAVAASYNGTNFGNLTTYLLAGHAANVDPELGHPISGDALARRKQGMRL